MPHHILALLYDCSDSTRVKVGMSREKPSLTLVNSYVVTPGADAAIQRNTVLCIPAYDPRVYKESPHVTVGNVRFTFYSKAVSPPETLMVEN